MLKLKKVWLFLFICIITFWIKLGYSEWALLTPYGGSRNVNISVEEWASTPKIDNKEIDENAIWEWTTHMWNKSSWIIHLPQPKEYETKLKYTLALIKIIINWTLWILASVALVYMLYSWFLVLSAWSDDKNVSKWKKWISTAAIAIAWIGISWLIISAMIRFINVITKANW